MSRITLPILLSLGWAQVVLLDGTSNAGSFESGNVCNTGTFTADGWTIVNGNQPNRWAIHTGAGAQHGSRAIYISTYNYPPIPGCTYIMTQNPQTVNLQAAGCCGGANFYDSGGPNGNYSNNENRTITFVAPPGQRVYVVFLSFNTEANFDFLRAYDGPNTGSPLIGTYSGTTLPPTINSTGNSLTFNFTSDGSVVGSGWSAMVFCGPPPPGCLAVPPHEYNIAASSVVHFYRDVTLPAGHSQMTISAYVKVQGEGTTTKYDYLDIRVTPTNVTPVAGTEVTSGNLVGRYNLISSNWTQITGQFCGTPGQTYRVIFSWHNDPSLGTQPPAAVDQIHITASPASGTSVVCDAPVLKDFPVVTSGNTAGAPPVVASPSCVTGGGCGIVARWYQFIPSAPNMTIHVMPGTLTDPAVAVFSAPSCEGPFTQLAFACNDNWTACDGSSRAARLELTGLVVGEIYYVAVFAGAGGGSGDYTLGIWQTGTTPPPAYGQDCEGVLGNDPATGPIRPCGPIMSFGNPGFVAQGFQCDFTTGTGCPNLCFTLSGERNMVWFRLPINANGNLTFSISPNVNIDYDWVLYRIDNVANPCQQIRTGALAPTACSYDAPSSCDLTYNTGMRCTPCRNPSTCEGGGGEGWVNCISVSAGQVYLLGISNFSTTTFAGFSINFGNSPIEFNPTRVWTGAASTVWNNNNNWGGCGFPTCVSDAVIFGGPANQPVIPAGNTFAVRNLRIAAGARLVVNGTLQVCGNLICEGELEGTGWIEFTGDAAVQEIRGILAGPTQYIPNLRINRTGPGVVRLMTSVQVGNLEIVSSPNNTLDLNQYTLLVRGNFTKGADGVFLHGNGAVYFNGSNQIYHDQGATPNPFYDVWMNQSPASTLTLQSRMDITNRLYLLSGRIVTQAHEVRVMNTATNAVTPGNPNSYVQGRLRRFIGGLGAYNFPVGTSSYQRAVVNFTAAPGVHNLLAWFNNWGVGGPPTPPNPTAECGAQYHNCPMLDNGYWTINAYQADLTTQVTTSGTYTLTLYNTGATPCNGAQQFGVLKNTGTGWVIQNPGCHANGSAATVTRPGMSGFSDFGTGQSPQPLPVYLLRWEGAVRADGSHHLRWDVNEEGARVAYFMVEVGRTPEALAPWRRFEREAREALRLDPPVGASFYRLRIHTSEGAEIHSNVLELRREAPPVALDRLEAFPNPTTGALTVRFVVNSTDPVRVSLWNALGQIVRERPITPAEAGLIELQFSLSDLAAGPYLLRVEQGDVLRTRLIWKE